MSVGQTLQKEGACPLVRRRGRQYDRRRVGQHTAQNAAARLKTRLQAFDHRHSSPRFRVRQFGYCRNRNPFPGDPIAVTISPIRVALAADSLLIGDGLHCLLRHTRGFDVVGLARDHDTLFELIDAHPTDVVVIALRSPIVTALSEVEAARRLRCDHPDVGLVVIADRGAGLAAELLSDNTSAVAFLLDPNLPSLDAVVNAIRQVRTGQTVLDPQLAEQLLAHRDTVIIDHLTVRELDVLALIAKARSNKAISHDLSISNKAVEKNITSIFNKLDLNDDDMIDRRGAAILIYLEANKTPFPVSRRQEQAVQVAGEH